MGFGTMLQVVEKTGSFKSYIMFYQNFQFTEEPKQFEFANLSNGLEPMDKSVKKYNSRLGQKLRGTDNRDATMVVAM